MESFFAKWCRYQKKAKGQNYFSCCPKFGRNSLIPDFDSKFLNLEISYFICNGSDSYQIAYTPDTEKTRQLIDAVANVRLEIVTYYINYIIFLIKFWNINLLS